MTIERKEGATPLTIFLITAVAILIVPPIATGTSEVYSGVAIVILVAITTVVPYACVVAVGTLPLLYANIASFAAPDPDADAFHSFNEDAALHVWAGFSYVVGATIVSAIGIGIQMTIDGQGRMLLEDFQPTFLIGSVIVAIAFVGTQLWRYDRPLRRLPLRTVFGTLVLGGLLALSIVAAFWQFNQW